MAAVRCQASGKWSATTKQRRRQHFVGHEASDEQHEAWGGDRGGAAVFLDGATYLSGWFWGIQGGVS